MTTTLQGVEKTFKIEAAITVKPGSFDPEGNTIFNYLASKPGYSKIVSIRVGKIVSLEVKASDLQGAKAVTSAFCDKAGLSSAVHGIEIRQEDNQNGAAADSKSQNVHVIEALIDYRQSVKNPEAIKISSDVRSNGYEGLISAVRVSKLLRIQVNDESDAEAFRYAADFCARQGVHNPVLHELRVRFKPEEQAN